MTRAYIPATQPKLGRRGGGRPPKQVSSEFNGILMKTLNDPKGQWARVRTLVDREEILALRDTLRVAARRMTESHPELLPQPGDVLKVDLLVTDEQSNEIAKGGVRGKTDWLAKIPDEGKFILWFRMHTPLERGERVVRSRMDGGGHLLLRTGGGLPKLGRPPLVLYDPEPYKRLLIPIQDALKLLVQIVSTVT